MIGAIALPASAQPACYAVLDASPASLAVVPGCDLTRNGAFRPGVIGGVSHPYNVRRGFDLDLYGSLSWYGPADWLVIASAGAGYAQRASDWAPSVRASLAFTRATPVAPFVTAFVMYTPAWHTQQDDTFVNIKGGVAVLLSNHLRLIGYLATAFSARAGWLTFGTGDHIAPGVSLIWFF